MAVHFACVFIGILQVDPRGRVVGSLQPLLCKERIHLMERVFSMLPEPAANGFVRPRRSLR